MQNNILDYKGQNPGEEYFTSCGIGQESNQPCFLTGVQAGPYYPMPTLTGYAESFEAAQNIVVMFNGRAAINKRTYDQKGFQVKVSVNYAQMGFLQMLEKATEQAGNKISLEIIQRVKQAAQIRSTVIAQPN